MVKLQLPFVRYEILTPNVVPKGFMDGKKAAQKMVRVLVSVLQFSQLLIVLVGMSAS